MLRRRALPLALASAVVASACGGAQANHPQHCPDGDRPPLDCASEVSYQGVDAQGSISALGAVQTSGKFQETAIRRVNDNVARYVAAQTRLCRDYNACVVDAQTYRAEASKTRDLLLGASELAAKLAASKDDPQQNHLLDKIYTSVVPEAQRSEELSFQMALEAQLPQSAGSQMLNVAPGQPLPTGTRVAFTFRTSRDAYLYIFQINAAGEVTVLFPDKRIGTSNPISGGVLTRVPSNGQAFRLNDKDLGIENVYVVASRREIGSLDSVVGRVTSGQVSKIGQDSLLANLASVKPASDGGCQGTKTRGLELEGAPSGASAAACTRTRGLVLDVADGSGGTDKPSIQAKTAPGDDTIIKVFPFAHVTEAAYPAAQQSYAGSDGVKTRGIIVED